MKNAASGRLTVVGIGFGFTVTIIKKTIGKRQNKTYKAEEWRFVGCGKKEKIACSFVCLYLHPSPPPSHLLQLCRQWHIRTLDKHRDRRNSRRIEYQRHSGIGTQNLTLLMSDVVLSQKNLFRSACCGKRKKGILRGIWADVHAFSSSFIFFQRPSIGLRVPIDSSPK